MPDDLQVVRIGAATVSVINVGNLRTDLGELLSVPPHERPPRYNTLFAQPLDVPVQCVYVRLPTARLLIDAGRYDVGPDSPYFIPGYQPPSTLRARLDVAGEALDAVDHVVLTHSHFDHVNGLTTLIAGQEEPCFPRARHYLGRADWEQPSLQDELRDPASLSSRTLGLLHQRDLLALVEGDHDLTAEVRLIAAPGESPGHQIVRIHSEGHTLYCVGDLYHASVEVEQPQWLVPWADPELMHRSRRVLEEAALAEDAFLVATHIRGVGRLQHTSAGLTWEVVPEPART